MGKYWKVPSAFGSEGNKSGKWATLIKQFYGNAEQPQSEKNEGVEMTIVKSFLLLLREQEKVFLLLFFQTESRNEWKRCWNCDKKRGILLLQSTHTVAASSFLPPSAYTVLLPRFIFAPAKHEKL